MPIAKVQMPDGRVAKLEVPEGTTQEQVMSYIQGVSDSGLIGSQGYSQNQHKQFAFDKDMEKYSPVGSDLENYAAGMGKSVYDTGRGIGNLVGVVSDKELNEAKRRDIPLMNTKAGIAGNITGHIGQMVIPSGLVTTAGKTLKAPKLINVGREMLNPTNWKTGATVGGAYGYIQPETSQFNRIKNATFAGIGGGIGGKIAGKLNGANIPASETKVINTVTTKPEAKLSGGGYSFGHVTPDEGLLNNAEQRILDVGKKLGFKVTPGQRAGSRSLQQMEAKLESQPMTSAPFNKLKDQNQETLNNIVSRSIGETSDVVDSATLGAAQNRISDVYKLVADDTERTINADDFLNVLQKIEYKSDGLIQGNILDNTLVKQFYKLAENGQATGRQLQSLASKMGKAAYKNMSTQSGDRDLGLALYQVRDYVDDLLSQGLNKETGDLFNQARGQYRNLMLLSQRNMVINPSTGNVQGNALAGLLQQKDKKGFFYGNNDSDLYNAARFSQAFRPLFGDSGTATRSTVTSPMDFLLSLPTSLTSSVYVNIPNEVNGILQGAKKVAPALPYTGYAGGLLGSEVR